MSHRCIYQEYIAHCCFYHVCNLFHGPRRQKMHGTKAITGTAFTGTKAVTGTTVVPVRRLTGTAMVPVIPNGTAMVPGEFPVTFTFSETVTGKWRVLGFNSEHQKKCF